MSSKVALLPPAAIFDPKLQGGHLRVLAALCYYGANRDRGCWYSYKTMGEQLGLSRRTIMDYIKFLCDCGYVEKLPRKRENGSSSTNTYRVKFNLDTDTGDGEPIRTTLVSHDSTGDGEPRQHPQEEPYKDSSEPNKLNKDKINKKPKLVTIQEWEANLGVALNASMLASWCKEKGLYHPTITRLIEEFRIEMMGKGKQYADFKAAFQTYLTKGYLSLTLAGAQETSKRDALKNESTTINRRGGSI